MDPLGKRLVKALLTEKTFTPLVEQGVSESDIFDDGLAAYQWSKKYYEDKFDWPTPKMLLESTGIVLPEDCDSLVYISDIIRKRTLAKKLAKDLEQASVYLEKRDPDTALKLIQETAIKVRTRSFAAPVVSYKESAKDRIREYKELKLGGGLQGIITPWPNLNKRIQGWVNGTLNVILAKTNTGKSWISCYAATHVIGMGKKALLITMEMSGKRMARRMDAIKYKIPFGELRDCALDSKTEERYEKELCSEETRSDSLGDVLIADKKTVKTVSDIMALTLEHKPDIVILDGGYRLGGKGDGSWEETKGIVRELQIDAETTNIPWVVTTQLGDATETGATKSYNTKMNMWKVRYGKEWIIDPDIVLGLEQTEDLRCKLLSNLYVLKERESSGKPRSGPIVLNWNLLTMNFSEVSEEEVPLEDTSTIELAVF